jgi:hypothetical protein
VRWVRAIGDAAERSWDGDGDRRNGLGGADYFVKSRSCF